MTIPNEKERASRGIVPERDRSAARRPASGVRCRLEPIERGDAEPIRGSRRPGRPTSEDSPDAFHQILVAARRLFAVSGFHGTQNREVAAAAGVSASAIYYYFSTKIELYSAVFRDTEREVHDRLAAEMAGATCAGERIAALVAGARAYHAREPSGLSFLAQAAIEARHNREVASHLADMPIRLEMLIRRTLREGQISGEVAPHVDVLSAADMVSAVLLGVAAYAPPNMGYDYDRIAGALESLIRGELFQVDAVDDLA